MSKITHKRKPVLKSVEMWELQNGECVLIGENNSGDFIAQKASKNGDDVQYTEVSKDYIKAIKDKKAVLKLKKTRKGLKGFADIFPI